MEINKKQFQKWIEALDSGEYSQGRSRLQSKEGYCCLGVACKVLIPENKQILNDNGWLEGGILEAQDDAPEWLKDISDDFELKTIYEYDQGVTIETMNDDMDMSFEEIATCLELVYIHKILE